MEPLSGVVFVFTGNMNMDRDEAKSRVLLLGARVTTAVSSKTTHLVVGDEPGPSKLKKAEELGITVINEADFVNLLNENKKCMNQEINTTIKSNTANEIIKNDEEDLSVSKINFTLCDTKKNAFTQSWAEKYRPQKMEDLIGNSALFEQLSDYILGKTGEKAALISGSPGIGKTSAALLICRKNNMYPMEFNASDFRSKKDIKEKIVGAALSRMVNNHKKVIIMDEVDGMTSDRGGIPELVNLIKSSNIPIICICNDKTHPKMRTLANHCLDLHCRKLDSRMILPRIKEILKLENKSLPDGILNEIILNSNCDFRFILNTVQSLVSKKQLKMESVVNGLVKKNVLKGIFVIASEIFQKKPISEKMDLYFEDYSLVPLFVQENYLKCNFSSIRDLLISSESISFSDVLDARIHGSEQEWSLMPYHAFYGCIYPLKNKILQKRMDFPLFLGQNSKMNKNLRLLSQISSHLKFKMSKNTFKQYFNDFLYQKFTNLLEAGMINECIEIIIETELLKEDIFSIGDVLGSDKMKNVSVRNKTALTKEYSKLVRRLSYDTGKMHRENVEEDSDE